MLAASTNTFRKFKYMYVDIRVWQYFTLTHCYQMECHNFGSAHMTQNSFNLIICTSHYTFCTVSVFYSVQCASSLLGVAIIVQIN